VVEVEDTGARAGPSPELPVALLLVEAQGGTLELDLLPGRGAVARIVLPDDAAPEAQQGTPAAH
jgi:hypothetical protein